MGSGTSTRKRLEHGIAHQCNLAIDQKDSDALRELMKYSVDNKINIQHATDCNSPLAHFVVTAAANKTFTVEQVRMFCSIFNAYNKDYPIRDYKWSKFVIFGTDKMLYLSDIDYSYHLDNQNGQQVYPDKDKPIPSNYVTKKYNPNMILKTDIPLYLILNGVKLLITKEKQEIVQVMIEQFFPRQEGATC
jgi:hypothetical protein